MKCRIFFEKETIRSTLVRFKEKSCVFVLTYLRKKGYKKLVESIFKIKVSGLEKEKKRDVARKEGYLQKVSFHISSNAQYNWLAIGHYLVQLLDCEFLF
jgi:hypothetical protein